MRVASVFKERSQVKSSGLDDSEDTSRQGVLTGPCAFLSSVPHVFTATIQKQFVGKLDISSPSEPSAKKRPSGKRGDRLSHLPQGTPRKNAPREKKSPGGSVSKVIPRRKFQAYLCRGPLASTTFPPISGPPVLGSTAHYFLVSMGPKVPKHTTRKKPVGSRTREFEPVAQEGTKRKKSQA